MRFLSLFLFMHFVSVFCLMKGHDPNTTNHDLNATNLTTHINYFSVFFFFFLLLQLNQPAHRPEPSVHQEHQLRPLPLLPRSLCHPRPPVANLPCSLLNNQPIVPLFVLRCNLLQNLPCNRQHNPPCNLPDNLPTILPVNLPCSLLNNLPCNRPNNPPNSLQCNLPCNLPVNPPCNRPVNLLDSLLPNHPCSLLNNPPCNRPYNLLLNLPGRLVLV